MVNRLYNGNKMERFSRKLGYDGTYQNLCQLNHTLFFATNTQNKYTGPMKKHVYKRVLLSSPLVQRVILTLYGWIYNQKAIYFLLILKLRLMVSINTLFFCFKPIQVATSAIEIIIHLVNKNRVLIKERRNSVTIATINFVRAALNRAIHEELIGTKFIRIGKG